MNFDLESELNALLADSVKLQKEEKEAQAARRRLRDSSGTMTAQTAEDAKRVAAWEQAHVWKDQANIALFTVQECACGSRREMFTGLFLQQAHRHLQGSNTSRIIRQDSQRALLPNLVKLETVEVPMCLDCVDVHGYPTATATYMDGAAVEWEDEGEA